MQTQHTIEDAAILAEQDSHGLFTMRRGDAIDAEYISIVTERGGRESFDVGARHHLLATGGLTFGEMAAVGL